MSTQVHRIAALAGALAAALGCALLMAPPASAASGIPGPNPNNPHTPMPTASTGTAPSTQDRSYASFAAETDLAEIQMAQVALERTSSSMVQSVARTIKTDHETAQRSLRQVATGLGLTVPSRPNPTQQAQLTTLRTVPAGDFDSFYLSLQINDHQQAIETTEQEIGDGTNPAVVVFAHVMLPQLQRHKQLAAQASHSLGVEAAATSHPSAVALANAAQPNAAHPTGSADEPWLIALGVVVLLVVGGGLLWVRKRVIREPVE